MAKQLRIKEIAALAGVSPGTVDRVLHNRGRVSEKSRALVERELEKAGYRLNIHTSAVSFNKDLTIVVSIPSYSPGEYWGSIKEGIDRATVEFSDINIFYHWLPYDQFDAHSCHSVFSTIPSLAPDAVIIGPTFKKETLELCARLDKQNIPYIFVDSNIEGTSPWAVFSTDQDACGRLMARLMDMMLPPDAEIAILGNKRIGDQRSQNSIDRERGFVSYFKENDIGRKVHKATYSPFDVKQTKKDVGQLFKNNPGIKGIAIMNSRGYIATDAIRENGIKDVKVICFDLTARNKQSLSEGTINVLLHQRPITQGYNAVEAVINRLLYHRGKGQLTIPADIVLRENLAFFEDGI